MNAVSTKPYLIRAIFEWCVDQDLTPHIVVKIDPRVRVPAGYARDGQIVLNISPNATGQLQISNEAITFQARFGGVAHALYVPVANVMGIYAAQTGQGMAFEMPEFSDEELALGEEAEADLDVEADTDSARTSDDAAGPDGTPPEDGGPPRARPDFLKVIK